MHEYTIAKDGMRYSEEELDPKVIEKRIHDEVPEEEAPQIWHGYV
jgi:hypothetical protein